MKTTVVLIFFLAQYSLAQAQSDSLKILPPDSSTVGEQNLIGKIEKSRPYVESDGVVIGNTKYFILIARTDPSIDPGMIIRNPDTPNPDRMPEPRFNTPGRRNGLSPNIDNMPEIPFNNPGLPAPDTTQHRRFK